jgi:hypothetical protein
LGPCQPATPPRHLVVVLLLVTSPTRLLVTATLHNLHKLVPPLQPLDCGFQQLIEATGAHLASSSWHACSPVRIASLTHTSCRPLPTSTQPCWKMDGTLCTAKAFAAVHPPGHLLPLTVEIGQQSAAGPGARNPQVPNRHEARADIQAAHSTHGTSSTHHCMPGMLSLPAAEGPSLRKQPSRLSGTGCGGRAT